MNSDDHHEVERRLRADADCLLSSDDCPSVEELLGKHRSRQRRRRLSASTAAVVLVALGVTLAQLKMPSNTEPVVTNPVEQVAPAIDVQLELPSHHLASNELLSNESMPVPVVLVGRNSDGTNVVMPGLYVPPAEPVNVDHLPPVQRRAIRQVLGLPKSLASKQSI